jgi:hypothetical protein
LGSLALDDAMARGNVWNGAYVANAGGEHSPCLLQLYIYSYFNRAQSSRLRVRFANGSQCVEPWLTYIQIRRGHAVCGEHEPSFTVIDIAFIVQCIMNTLAAERVTCIAK